MANSSEVSSEKGNDIKIIELIQYLTTYFTLVSLDLG